MVLKSPTLCQHHDKHSGGGEQTPVACLTVDSAPTSLGTVCILYRDTIVMGFVSRVMK